MKVAQQIFNPARGWKTLGKRIPGDSAQLVLAFGGRHLLETGAPFEYLKVEYPRARIVLASTAGEIAGTEISEDHIVSTAISFEKTRVECAAADVEDASQSFAAGRALAGQLAGPDLVSIFVVSDGQRVNGTELARGLGESLAAGVILTGGLAGDGTRFEKTLVGLDEHARPGRIAAIGFYGRDLQVKFGSAGGWAPFGPVRTVTRAEGNTLFELDGKSALQLYKTYLGDKASELPGSALRFPLKITPAGAESGVVRTILSIDEKTGGMVFAGDIPNGALARFMRASYEDLVDGAAHAAEETLDSSPPSLVLCVSCVGRRIMLGQRIEEETEIVRDTLGPVPTLAGFYSYGELSPSSGSSACQLHNQTMTITTMLER
ncbi:MAG TPA: FIST N-terminal domain-containing protein [Opitutaceae bacterium]|nr:FIST N-terminal domain-containing protein [Opitutaceae bacterium]